MKKNGSNSYLGRRYAYKCPECGKRNPPDSHSCRGCGVSFFAAPEPGEYVTSWLQSFEPRGEQEQGNEKANPSAETPDAWLSDLTQSLTTPTDTPQPTNTNWLDQLDHIARNVAASASAETDTPAEADPHAPQQLDLFDWAFELKPAPAPSPDDELPPAPDWVSPTTAEPAPTPQPISAEIQARQAALLRQYTQQQARPPASVQPMRPTPPPIHRPLATIGLVVVSIVLLGVLLTTVAIPAVLAEGLSATVEATSFWLPLNDPTVWVLFIAALTLLFITLTVSWHRKRTRQQT